MSGPTFFDMGESWGRLREQYGLSNEDMFDAFLLRFLGEQAAAGKPVRFAQDPLADAGLLRRQLDFLLARGYLYEATALTALPPRPSGGGVR